MLTICIFFLSQATASDSAIAKDKTVNQITEQLQVAIDTKNRRQLFETTKQIYAIWRGEKDAENLWIALRDTQAKSLLQSLELLHEHVDWQFDKTKYAEHTLDPPLDYSIMGYSKGFGTRLIEDPILKAEIKAKLKVELSRLKKAKLERSFQRQVNNHYDSWLGAFLRLLRNSFSEKNAQSNKAYITHLTKQTLKPSEFRDFALYVISSFYDQEKEIIEQINKHQGDCESLLKNK